MQNWVAPRKKSCTSNTFMSALYSFLFSELLVNYVLFNYSKELDLYVLAFRTVSRERSQYNASTLKYSSSQLTTQINPQISQKNCCEK